ncbi:MAG TPA: TetR/AcrR family transcriptional regulator [Gammaproteobacteria bacterium]|jgi:AcrR family transcriptional regulator|nr:TetR/AcrR family transcriptional regulator [Gammaproteobacteria bacterium]
MTAGRKRTFDKDEALVKAMHVFWENGYSGTSLSDLTAALGINKPSMYAAFGNKEELFAAALEYYLIHYRGPLITKLTDPPDAPLAQRLQAFLLGVVDVVNCPDSPKGCFYTKTCYESDSAAVPEEITTSLHMIERETVQNLVALLKTEQANGQLSADADLKTLARYLMTIMTGLSVQAKNGASKAELKSVVEWVAKAAL